MPMKIRGYRPEDQEILYAICLQTGAAGKDATRLFQNPALLGDIYAAPYMRLAPQLIFVAEDEEGVAGYILGALDSAYWEEKLQQDWWPIMQEAYPLSLLDRSDCTPAARDCIQRIHAPQPTPTDLVARYPAHIHMNLLPRLQGMGVGRLLLKRWFDIALNHGVQSVHLGVSRQNCRGIVFWQKRGFEAVDVVGAQDQTLWMGQHLSKPLSQP